jgi:3-dehydroquinate dehydratase
MSMGPVGMITRVVGHRAGSALTFAAVAPGGGSAPGQLSIAELRACWVAMGEARRAGDAE